MVAAARRAGYDMRSHRAQQISAAHVREFDLIVCMDSSVMATAASRFPDAERAGKLRLFLRDYAPKTGRVDMPDPYYEDNYEEVVRLVEAGCDGLVEHLRSR